MPDAELGTNEEKGLEKYKVRKIRLADGGYFENSGIEVALSIAEALRKVLDFTSVLARDRNLYETIIRAYEQYSGTTYTPLPGTFVVKVIAFQNADYRYWIDADPYGFSEVTSPLRVLMATRQKRGELAELRAVDEFNCPHCFTPDLAAQEERSFGLSISDYPIPLGWYMSATSFQFISQHVSDFRDCRSEGGKIMNIEEANKERLSNFDQQRELNACENFLIAHDVGIAVPLD